MCDGEHTNRHVSGVRSMLATLGFLTKGILEKEHAFDGRTDTVEVPFWPPYFY